MVKSTQSVSWPKRDSIYSVLRHLGPFACIITVLCSENPISSKTRSEVIFQFKVSRGHPVQLFGGFEVFHRPRHIWGLWKTSKKHNHIAEFGCGNFEKTWQFFQKISIFLLKIIKNTKEFLKKCLTKNITLRA